MARLFGLISKQPVDLSVSVNQTNYPTMGIHGWGLGWYDTFGKITIEKKKLSAVNKAENLPHQTTIQSNLLLLHMRRATSGIISDRNTHPFTYKNYIFAHTGTVHKEYFLEKLQPPYNVAFQSEPIDSEILFRYLVQCIERLGEKEGLQTVLQDVLTMQSATFLLSNGETLYAFRNGEPLYWLLWKGLTPFSTIAKETGLIIQSSYLSQTRALIVASERLTNDNWMIFDDGELLVVQNTLNYSFTQITKM